MIWGKVGEDQKSDLAPASFNVNDLSNYFLSLSPQFYDLSYFFGITFITLHNLIDGSEGRDGKVFAEA